MPISNLNNTHLTQAQINDANKGLDLIEKAMETIVVNLSEKERQKYGSINEQNKLFVNKVNDYQKTSPQLLSDDVDWDEFNNDYVDRETLESLINRITILSIGLSNAKVLLDRDNLQDALTDYSFATYKAGSTTPGFERKYKELKQFFIKSSSNPRQGPPNDEPKEPEA